MELDYKKYNCMLDKYEENVIGYVKNIMDLYKQYAKDLIDFLGYSDFDNVKEVIELLEELEKLDKDYLIKIYPCYHEHYSFRVISKDC